MLKKLSEQHRRFAQQHVAGKNGPEAAVAAGFAARSARTMASHFLADPLMQEYIKTLRAPMEEDARLSLKAHLDRLQALSEKAEEAGQFGPAVTAEVSRGKASDLYKEKLDVRVDATIDVPDSVRKLLALYDS